MWLHHLSVFSSADGAPFREINAAAEGSSPSEPTLAGVCARTAGDREPKVSPSNWTSVSWINILMRSECTQFPYCTAVLPAPQRQMERQVTPHTCTPFTVASLTTASIRFFYFNHWKSCAAGSWTQFWTCKNKNKVMKTEKNTNRSQRMIQLSKHVAQMMMFL